MLLQQAVRWHGLDDDVTKAAVLDIRCLGRLSLGTCSVLLAVADLCVIVPCSVYLFAQYPASLQYGFGYVCSSIGGVALLWLLISGTQNLYRRAVLLGALRSQLWCCSISVALTFGLLLLLAHGVQVINGARSFDLVVLSAITLGWQVALRVAWRRFLCRILLCGRCLDRSLMLAGSLEAGRAMSKYIEQETHGQVRFAAVTTLPGVLGGPPVTCIEDAVRNGLVDRVFVAHVENAVSEANALLDRLGCLAVDVTIVPKLMDVQAPMRRLQHIGRYAVIDVSRRPLSVLQVTTKRIEDLVLASLLLVLAVPLLLLICMAIRLDTPGPLFFRQWRAGYHEQPFRVWKFRTMHHSLSDEAALRQTRRADPRVTRIGRLLRRTSLDELPQLWNVVRGEMSIVGPRPHALGMTVGGRAMHELALHYGARHRVKPGMTGWAQVCGCRGEVESLDKLRQRVAFDCYYIENWSLGFDLWILLRTVAVLLFDKTAY